MDISRRTLLSSLSLIPAARALYGYQDGAGEAPRPAAQPKAGQPSTFSADVKVVNIFATVRDKKGAIVPNLNKDDFIVDEEGHPQAIRYFSRESNLPLSLGLLVDTSGSMRRVLNDERSASYKFFDQILRQDRDLAFVIHFDHEVELMQDLTPSRQKLENAINAIQADDRRQQQQQQPQGGSSPNGGGYPGGGRRYPGGGNRGGMRGGTKLYDAILLACDELTSKQKGRKSLVLLSDGVDTGSKTTQSQAISSAQHADTLVYTILFADSNSGGSPAFGGPGMGRRRGMGYPGGGYPGGGYPGGGGGGRGYNRADGKKVLQQIAQETGGRFFEVSHHEPIDKIYAAIEEDLRAQYNIGYTSDQPDNGGAYRHIHVTVKSKGMTVWAREGYYPAEVAGAGERSR
jgi:VWFA-related protein